MCVAEEKGGVFSVAGNYRPYKPGMTSPAILYTNIYTNIDTNIFTNADKNTHVTSNTKTEKEGIL